MKIQKDNFIEITIITAIVVLLMILGIEGCREARAEEPISAGDRVVDLVGREGTVLKAQGCGAESFTPIDGTGAVLVQWDDEGNVPEWKSTEYVFKRGSRS